MSRFASGAGAALTLALSILAFIGCGPSGGTLDGGLDGAVVDAYREPEDAGPPRAIFELPRTDDAPFFDLPWPSDVRVTADGTVDVRNFPNPRSIELIDDYIATIVARQRGFSTNGSVYFRFSRSIDPASLPADAAASLETGASVFLVDIDDGATRLTRHPVTVEYQDADTLYWSSRTLSIAPVHGIPLAGGHRFAAVVTRGVHTVDGSELARDADFASIVDGGGDATVDSARTLYQDALDAVVESGTAADEVLALAVFTTQDPVASLALYRDWIHAEYPAPAADADAWERIADRPTYQQVEGSYGPVPVFQAGEIPYEHEGGAMELGPDGQPVVHGEIDQRFAITLPLGAMPATGYPLVIYAHGTGGSYRSFISDGTGSRLAQAGLATLGVDLIHHGDRNPTTASPELLFVNIQNPDAAPDNIRQNALDFVTTARAVRTMVIPNAVAEREGMPVRFDPERIYFFGHSQGALVAPIYMGIDDGVRGGVVSAGGAVIGYALLEKVEPVSIPEVLRLALGLPGATLEEAFRNEGFGFQHPAVTLVQGWIDRSDPANFGHLAFASPRPGFAPKHVLSTEGLLDPYSPPGAIEALAVSMRVPLLTPVGREIPAFELLGIGVHTGAVSGNVADGLATAGLLQYPEQGHFAVFNDTIAQDRIRGFFETMVAGTATIPAAP